MDYKRYAQGSVVSITILDNTFSCPYVYSFAGIVENTPQRVNEQSTLDQLVDLHAQGDAEEYSPSEYGELVLARDEGNFYRAVALGQSKVCFLDYGNSAVVTQEDVRRMPENFLHTPPFVHLFHFHGEF
jgi:hypothetical protein